MSYGKNATLKNFLSELKRRNVYKVAVAYAVVGWLLVQVTTQVFPIFEIPNWALRLIVLAIVIGFPIALVLAWAFELTPEGIKRTEDVDRATEKRGKSHGWIYVVAGGAVLSIGLFFLGRFSRRCGVAAYSGGLDLVPDLRRACLGHESFRRRYRPLFPRRAGFLLGFRDHSARNQTGIGYRLG